MLKIDIYIIIPHIILNMAVVSKNLIAVLLIITILISVAGTWIALSSLNPATYEEVTSAKEDLDQTTGRVSVHVIRPAQLTGRVTVNVVES